LKDKINNSRGVNMFKKILVCLDGSEIAEKIVPFVREEASATGSKIILLRVVIIPSGSTLNIPGFPATRLNTSSIPEELKDDNVAEAYLEQVAQPIRKQGIQVECKTLIGSPGPTIISYANENNIDLIAIASHGHSGLRNVLVGSVAEYVLRESVLPILMIRPK
jgi:nucleotide-binding universal stress UspA family protein